MVVEFVIDGHPPSTNNLFLTRGRFRIKTPQYRTWEAKVERIVQKHPMGLSGMRSLNGAPFMLEIEVFKDSWLQKNLMAIKKPDASNLIKSAEDAVCRVSGWKDQNAISVLVTKVECAGPDRTVMRFKFVDKWFTPKQ